ncbi:TPA: DUF4234 domain-containing protein [Thermoplasmata archaeon]|nr:DUF4234 domain-containing protein [Thermoplasmata archaeon]
MSQSDGGYCIFCGMRLPQKAANLRPDDVKSLGNQLLPIVEDKNRTDIQVSTLWVIIPFVVLLILGIVMVAIIFAEAIDLVQSDQYDPDDPTASYDLLTSDTVLLSAATIAVYLFLTRLTYDLVKRHNLHFEREWKLRNTVSSFVSRVTGERFGFYSMEKVETKRSPALWASVIILPSLVSMLWIVLIALDAEDGDIDVRLASLVLLLQLCLSLLLLVAQFYLFYFLTSDMANHHKRWMAFVHDTRILLAHFGYTAGWLTEPRRLNDRSVAVYVVASIFTGGLFLFYWWYAIVKDGNEHMRHHRVFERELMELLAKPETT